MIRPPMYFTSRRPAMLALLIAVILSTLLTAQTAKIGEFEGHGDIGAPKLSGTAAYNPVSQEYAICRRRHQHVGRSATSSTSSGAR